LALLFFGEKVLKYMIVSAWEPEQAWLRRSWEEKPRKLSVEFHLLGIGPLRAAAQLSKLLAVALEHGVPFSEVIFVGTSGSFLVSKIPLKSVIVSDSVWFTEGGAIAADSYFPAQVSQNAVHFRGSLPSEFAGQNVCSVCVPSITSSAALAEKLFTLGDVENLELAGVAQACDLYGLNWWSVLGISNEVGPRGHEEWKINHLEVSLLAQQKLLGFLEKR
jgi:nucleoside phosphorylase